MAESRAAKDYRTSVVVSRWVGLSVMVAVAAGLVLGQIATSPGGHQGPSTVTVEHTPGPTEKTETTTDATGDKTVTTRSTDSPSIEVTKTDNPDHTWSGLLLANPVSLIVIDLLAALLVGFLAGAAVQRVIVGYYGIKIGPLELDAVPSPVTEKEVAATAPKVDAANLPDHVGLVDIPGLRDGWWTRDGDPTEPPVVLFRYQRVRVETIVRMITPDDSVDYEAHLSLLSRMDAGLASSLLDLDELAGRVLVGATISGPVARSLSRLFDTAAHKMLYPRTREERRQDARTPRSR